MDLGFPTEGVRRVRAVLRGDCMGVPSTFADPARTCRRKGSESVLTTEGVEALDGGVPVTEVGTWGRAREAPCASAAPDGATCIAGGFAVVGEPSLTHVSDGVLSPFDPTPARPAAFSPFQLDIRRIHRRSPARGAGGGPHERSLHRSELGNQGLRAVGACADVRRRQRRGANRAPRSTGWLAASAHGQVVNGLPKHDVSAQSILPSASLSTPSWHSASVRSAAHLVTEGLI